MKRSDQIKDSIKNLEGYIFEKFVYELFSRELYPGLIPTSRSGDLGEDARTEQSTVFLHQGKKLSLAVSKESGWGKVKKDCNRCLETKREIDILIFVTAGNPQTSTIEDWEKKVNNKYPWDLEVRTVDFIAPFANHPKYEDIVDDYLNIPPKGGDYLQQILGAFEKETTSTKRNISVHIPGIEFPIERDELKRIEDQLELGKSVLLTGEAGSGKSGIAHQLSNTTTKFVVFLDARRLANAKNVADLKNHFGLKGSLNYAIIKIAKTHGCRLIIDQLDNGIGLPISDLLVDLIMGVFNQRDLEITLISRKRETHEIKFLEKLLVKEEFVELKCNLLPPDTVKTVFTELGIKSPGKDLIKLGMNILNLEIICRIIQNNTHFNLDRLSSEIELWETYIETIKEREGQLGEKILSEAIKLSKQGSTHDDRTFVLDYHKTPEQKRLESWRIIIPDYGLTYHFYHEKLQEYLLAYDATQRGISQQEVIDEIGDSFRTRNILILIREIYTRHSPTKVPKYLREIWNV